MRPMTSWGRLVSAPHDVVPLRDRHQVASQLAERRTGIAYGMGRSYGDECLNPNGVLWHTVGLDHFIDFDPATGLLTCEAGVLLRDIQRVTLPHGWLLPVTPGTQLITVGGAIANDVHGKNHHALGSFGDHVRGLSLARTDGETIECGPDQRPDWFAATVGGMGLTGVIVAARIQLRKVDGPWLETETLPYRSLEEFFVLSDSSEADWEHTVSWIDCVSATPRGLFMRGRHVDVLDTRDAPVEREGQMTMPVVPPISLVNSLSLRPFNTLYFHKKKLARGRQLAHYTSFSYPLDNLLEWNRMYGPRGFFQYQSVVPRASGREATEAMIAAIARAGSGSFLAVLKTFGERSAPGLLSFPQPGVTLALDFPNQGPSTHRLLAQLDDIVRSAGGRLYAAKDARMPRDLFESGYPALPTFMTYRDPNLSSAMSRRLMGS